MKRNFNIKHYEYLSSTARLPYLFSVERTETTLDLYNALMWLVICQLYYSYDGKQVTDQIFKELMKDLENSHVIFERVHSEGSLLLNSTFIGTKDSVTFIIDDRGSEILVDVLAIVGVTHKPFKVVMNENQIIEIENQ